MEGVAEAEEAMEKAKAMTMAIGWAVARGLCVGLAREAAARHSWSFSTPSAAAERAATTLPFLAVEEVAAEEEEEEAAMAVEEEAVEAMAWC